MKGKTKINKQKAMLDKIKIIQSIEGTFKKQYFQRDSIRLFIKRSLQESVSEVAVGSNGNPK